MPSDPVSSPPSYDYDYDYSLDEADLEGVESVPELPGYTRHSPQTVERAQSRPALKEFPYALDRKGKKWAVLTVLANGNLSKQLPTFVEGSVVTGSVTLILEREDPIQAITVSVKGQIITGAQPGDQFTFLELSRTLWSHSTVDPRNPQNGRPSGNLSPGEYVWPFSIEIPREVVVGAHGTPQVFRPPQTFLERHTRATIQYDILVHFARKKLRTDHRIQAAFGYIPISRPAPPSLLRQLSYREDSPILGPEVDPNGWYVLNSVSIRGKVFKKRSVNAHCTFSLATPLCYTRGSVIPCAMTIETEDLQALDLLSSPKAMVVRLRRCVKYHADTGKAVDSFAWKDEISHYDLATWWAVADEAAGTLNTTRRHLQGELHLKADLKPSSAIAHFRVEYSVVLFPFDAAAFESADTQPLMVAPIEIVTMYATGPRPRIYAPPLYESYYSHTNYRSTMADFL